MSSNLLIYLYYLLIAIIYFVIIFNTRTPSKALAYIFLVTVFPFIGTIIYFAIGFNYRKKKLYSKKINVDLSSFPELEGMITKFSKESIESHIHELDYFYPLINSSAFKNLISHNNNTKILVNGENKFPEVLQSLRLAKNHIHLEYYIFENDDISNQIGKILISKAKEGLKIRFIYDDFGSNSIRKKFVQCLKDSGVECYAFYKINLMHFANRVNYRNHRKIIVIDGLVGYVGGINVSDKYINSKNSKLYWRDTHLKINGLSVLNLQYIFLTDWNFCANQTISFSSELFPTQDYNKYFGKSIIQIVSSGPDSDYPNIMYSYIQAILLAREEILLTTPYFIPDKSFSDAIKIAALSGVKIKILIPGVSDSVFVNAISNSNYAELLEVDIQIYKYNKGFIHAKTAIFDNRVAFVGTTNLDNRSFDLNFEVNAIVYDNKISNELSNTFYDDLQFSEELTLSNWNKRPLFQKVFERTTRLFSPLV